MNPATPRRIAFLSARLDVGGVQKALVSLANALAQEGHEVTIWLQKREGELLPLVSSDVRVPTVPGRLQWMFIPRGGVVRALWGALGTNLNALRFLRYLAQGLRSGNMARARQRLAMACANKVRALPERYDIACDITGAWKGIMLATLQASRYLSWVHGDYPLLGRERAIDEADYRRIHGIVFVTPSCMQVFVDEFPHLAGKCSVVRNIVDKAQVQALASQEVSFDEGYQGFRVLTVTRLDMQKGLGLALEACRLVVQAGYNLRWYVLGDGEDRAELEELIRQQRMEDRFILLGTQVNPYAYMRKADAVVLCSYNEGRSVAIDEAMLLAKPIILTDYPSARDQITAGVNGLICGLSGQEVADSVMELMDHPQKRAQLSRALVDFVIDRREAVEAFFAAAGLPTGEPNISRKEGEEAAAAQ